MTFKISEFRSQVGAIARPNLFSVKIKSIPAGISQSARTNFTINDLKNFEFRCEATEMPGRTVATIDDNSPGGPSVKLPYDMTYNDLNLTIICSEDMKERRVFEFWMDQTVLPYNDSYSYGGLVRYYDKYAYGSKFEISQLNASGTALAKYVLFDAFPIAISPMNLTWEESNTYQRFTVTLTYRYHVFIIPIDNPYTTGYNEKEDT